MRGGAGLLIVPRVGSFVLVVMLSETDSFVGMFSEIEQVSFVDVNGFEFKIKGSVASVKNRDYSFP